MFSSWLSRMNGAGELCYDTVSLVVSVAVSVAVYGLYGGRCEGPWLVYQLHPCLLSPLAPSSCGKAHPVNTSTHHLFTLAPRLGYMCQT